MDSFFVIGTKRVLDNDGCPLTEDKQYYEYYRTDSTINRAVLGGLFGADVFQTIEEAKKAWNEDEAYFKEQFFQRAFMFDVFYDRKSTAILEIGVKDEIPLT